MNHISLTWWRHDQPAGIQVAYSGHVEDGGNLAYWAILMFTFILLLAPQEHFPFLAPLRIAMLTAMLAIAAHLYSRLSRGLPVIDLIPVNMILLALLTWIIACVPFSMWPGGSITFLLEHYLKTLIVFVLLGSVVDTLPKLKKLCWALVLMAVVLALTTVKNFLAGNTLGNNDRVVGYMASLTANPNDMALMLNLILPVCIALFLDGARPIVRILLGGIALLLVVAVIATFSRAGFLTLGVIFVCYMWQLRNRPERKWGIAALLIVLVSLPWVPAGYVDRINTIVEVEEDTSNSAQIRLRDMKAAVLLVIDNPLIGAGVGMNQLAMNEARGATWTEVHNVYLQYAVELGLPGLILFLAFFGKCLGTTAVVMKSCRGNNSLSTLFHIAEGIRVSLYAFFVAAMFHPVAYHFYFYYFAGLAVAAGEIGKRALRPANPDAGGIRAKIRRSSDQVNMTRAAIHES